jgi:hypothetical protein
VQALVNSRAIFATESVVMDSDTAKLLQAGGIEPVAQRHTLRGIEAEVTLYEIP